MASKLSKLKLLIVDDHELFRLGLKNTLLQVPYIKKIDEAISGVEALKLIKKNKYDIVFLDIQMPKMDGVETLHQVRLFNNDIKIIALSMFADENYIMDMYNRGINGYLLKNTDKNELNRAIENVMENENYYTPMIREKLFKALLKKDGLVKKSALTKIELSKREIEVLILICNQYASQEIGEILYITDNTVNTHRKNLLEKTSSKNLAGLVLYALRHGLYSL